MLFVPVNERAWILAAARKSQRKALRKATKVALRPEVSGHPHNKGEDIVKKNLHSFSGRILRCPEHTDMCLCVQSYRTQRQHQKVRRRYRRNGTRSVLMDTWKNIPKDEKVKHLSLKQCRSFGISYQHVTHAHDQNNMIENLRIMSLRLILQLWRIDPEYRIRYSGFTIPKERSKLYALARSLCRKIQRTVLPITGQWAPVNWKPIHSSEAVLSFHEEGYSSVEEFY